MIVTLCKLYDIPNASIKIACDNLLALNNALDKTISISTKDPEHVLLFDIRSLLDQHPILWKRHLVHGHQDSKKATEDLDKWECLNVEMDTLAKATLVTMQHPHNYPSTANTLYLSLHNSRLAQNIEKKLYYHVHGRKLSSTGRTKVTLLHQQSPL